MGLQDVAAVAEIIGVFTIVITFLFLGLQIRESNRAARAATLKSLTESEVIYTAQFLTHAEIWNKVITNQPIDDPVELRKGMQLFGLYLIDVENRYQQFRLGYIDEDTWRNREDITREIINLDIFDFWYESFAGRARSAEFRRYIKSLRAS